MPDIRHSIAIEAARGEIHPLVAEARGTSGGSSVLLDFAHGGWHEETPYFISCNTTWGASMFRLRAAAEGKQPGPLFKKSSLAY